MHACVYFLVGWWIGGHAVGFLVEWWIGGHAEDPLGNSPTLPVTWTPMHAHAQALLCMVCRLLWAFAKLRWRSQELLTAAVARLDQPEVVAQGGAGQLQDLIWALMVLSFHPGGTCVRSHRPACVWSVCVCLLADVCIIIISW